MQTFSDKEIAVARVYAQALLALAEPKGEADAMLEELLALSDMLEKDDAFTRFLSSPMVDVENRKLAIEKAFRGRALESLVDAIQVINRKGRAGLIQCIAAMYRLAHEELRGQIDVHVRTVVPLSDAQRSRLGEVTEQQTGLKAVLVETVDAALIGGMIVQIGDTKYDMSVTAKLVALGRLMDERASRELHSGKTILEKAG